MNTPNREVEFAKVDQTLFCETLADALARGESVMLRVQGASMRPWLREGDRIRIRPAAERRSRRGDIALFWRGKHRLVLHRVVRVHPAENTCECLGDAEHGLPERVAASAVVGVVESAFWSRMMYLALHPARRFFNRHFQKWRSGLGHG